LFEAFSEVLGVVEELEEYVGVDLVGDVELVWCESACEGGPAGVVAERVWGVGVSGEGDFGVEGVGGGVGSGVGVVVLCVGRGVGGV
jgi:hypothetical protein